MNISKKLHDRHVRIRTIDPGLSLVRTLSAPAHLKVLADAGSAEGAFILGVHEMQRGQVGAARAWYERALELNPGHEQTEDHLRSLQDVMVENPGTDAG